MGRETIGVLADAEAQAAVESAAAQKPPEDKSLREAGIARRDPRGGGGDTAGGGPGMAVVLGPHGGARRWTEAGQGGVPAVQTETAQRGTR